MQTIVMIFLETIPYVALATLMSVLSFIVGYVYGYESKARALKGKL